MANERYGHVEAVSITAKEVNTTVQSVITPTLISTLDLSQGGALAIDLESSTAEVELITNGSFTGTSGWTGWGAVWVNQGGIVARIASVTSSELSQTLSLTTDVIYKITFDVVTTSASMTVTPKFTGATPVLGSAQSMATAGTYTQYLMANSSSTGLSFIPGGSGTNGDIDNVSIKAITTLKLTNPKSGSCYLIKVINGSTPKTLLQFNPFVLWAGGSPGYLTATDNAVDIYAIYYDGSDYFISINNDYRIK